jgi:hypothetical protein
MNDLQPLIALRSGEFKAASNCTAEQTTYFWMLLFQDCLRLVDVA